jgi:hypothetical protein
MPSTPGVPKKKSSVAQALMKWVKWAGWPGPVVHDFFLIFLFQLMLLFYFLKKLIIFILKHLSLLFYLESFF